MKDTPEETLTARLAQSADIYSTARSVDIDE